MTIPVEFSAADIRVEMAAPINVEVSVTGPMGPKGEDGTPGSSGFVAQPEPPADTGVLWLDTDEEPAPGGGGLDLATADARYVNVDGDTVPGPFELSASNSEGSSRIGMALNNGANAMIGADGPDGSDQYFYVYGWAKPTESQVVVSSQWVFLDAANVVVSSLSPIKVQTDNVSDTPQRITNLADAEDPTDAVNLQTLEALASGGGGSTILSGTATPGDATGALGDYYLDTDDRVLYGPKASVTLGPEEYVSLTMSSTTTTGAGLMVGMKYRFAAPGQVTGIRFWVPPTADVLTGWACYLFTGAGGAPLANKSAGTLTPGAWNTATFDTPVAVAVGTTYVAAAWAIGVHGRVWGDFTGGATSGNVTAIAYGVDGPVGTYTSSGKGNCPLSEAGEHFSMTPVFRTAPSPWPVALKSVPPGGTTGQYLKKTSGTDYAVAWVT